MPFCQQRRHQGPMKKVAKWAGIAIVVPILLFALLALLFYFPPFQNWAVKQVAAYASRQTGMEISVEHVNLDFPLNLGIDGVRVLQPNDSLPQVRDTVADVGHVVADIRLLPLLRKQVEIDELRFNDLKVNTANLIHEVRIRGRVGQLALKAHGIDLNRETVRLNEAQIADGSIQIELSDTVPADTAPSKNFWKIRLDSVRFTRTALAVHLPGDTLSVAAMMQQATATGGYLDLHKGLYTAASLLWQGGTLQYDNNFEPRTEGLDFNHLALEELTLKADSFYYCDSRLNIRLRASRFREKSGLAVSSLSGPFSMDSTRLWLPALAVRTPESTLDADFAMDLNTFDDRNPGKLKATVHGSIGKQDLMRFVADVPAQFRRHWPNYPLRVDGVVRGNMQKAHFTGLVLRLPTAFNLTANGFVTNVMGNKPMGADIDVDARTYNLAFLTALLDRETARSIRIPSGIGLKGNLKKTANVYAARFTAREGGGSVGGTASVDVDRMAYQAKLRANNLPLQHFVPGQGLHAFTGTVDARGVGTDFLSPRTSLAAKINIARFRYGDYNLDHMSGVATVANGRIKADVNSRNRLLMGQLSLNAQTSKRSLQGTFSFDLSKADLFRLGIADSELSASLSGHVDVNTDFRDYYKVQGRVSNISVADGQQSYRPDDVVLDVLANRDTTHAVVDCGDFHLNLNARGGYRRVLAQGSGFVTELQRQLKNRHIDQVQLRSRLPLGRIYLTSGRNNIVGRILQHYGYTYGQAFMDMTSSPVAGLNGNVQIESLTADSIQIDTVKFAVSSDATEMTYTAQVRNNKKNPQYVFNALFNGNIDENGTNLTAQIFDEDDKLGISLGVAGDMEPNGIRLYLFGDDPILGYKKFTANADNYVFLGDDRRISANLKLTAADGMGVQVYTNDEDRDHLQNVTVTLHQFDLEKVLSVIPYTPDVAGMMNGDLHLIQTADELSVSSDVRIENMFYEQNPMGNVGAEIVYMPRQDGSHYVDGILYHDENAVGTLRGTYNSAGAGFMDATLELERLPLSMMNGFIPEQLFGFRGYGDGELKIRGALSKPDVDGEVYLDSASLMSAPYGVEMRFANDPVRIEDSKLLFENFELYANNDSPLNVSGSFDFSNTNRMMLDVRLRAQNFEIIDAKENPRSEAYGKAFVNFYGAMRGPIENLSLLGRLEVLGSTDMTYVLRDSELATDTQLDELVKFTDFNDTTTVQVVQRPQLTGFNMNLSINVDESAHIICMLNADHSNYIDLMGGGDLRLSYNPTDDIRLTGRYTLNNGEMKYSLPVIPLKTFTIQDGSYIEFQGEPYNPLLHIAATERMKASVNEGTGQGRQVEFETGVRLSKTLNSPGIEFIIEAPNDMSIQDELNTMTAEGRSKVAITMLASGMYLSDGNTRAFSMNSALSSFLQTEINNVAGSALRSMGLDLGMSVDNTVGASGAMHTDYNFRFAKRLWNNRLNIVVGGKVSSGSDLEQGRDQTFFDNVELEYRLDQNSSKYLRLFYNNNKYDWLEGPIGEYGAGFMWRRKLQHFWDIFNFKSDKVQLPQQPRDSVRNEKK